MVRELAERGVLRGNRSDYISTVGAAEVSVPATVQATIAARIDRLEPAAKRTLSAAAVIGSRFDPGLLETLGIIQCSTCRRRVLRNARLPSFWC
jgi:predicted ATPase